MGSRLGLGWVENPPDNRDFDIDRLGLVAGDFDEEVSLSGNISRVLNQGSTQSCVAQMAAGAIDILETNAGLPYVAPSRLFMYFNSRAYHHMQGSDDGTFIRACMKGLKKYGVPDEKHWEFSESSILVNQRPGWNPYMMGHSRRNGTYNWILDGGQGRVDAIKTALLSGYPVGFGTLVTKEFTRKNGPAIEGVPGSSSDIVGGHAMLVVGYKDTPDGLLFEVLNSWGTSWRNDGLIYLTEDYIRWTASRDFVVVHGWDRLQK